MRPLKVYERKLAAIEIVWVNGKELGYVATDLKPEARVDLLLYNHKAFSELVGTLTHEIVHLVHPEIENNEGAIEAMAQALLRRPAWVRRTGQVLGHALFALVITSAQKKRVLLG